jgi:hypothetical protein
VSTSTMNNSISEIRDVRIELDADTRFTASDRGMPFLQRLIGGRRWLVLEVLLQA